MQNDHLVFLGAKRTPFGANGGSLKDVNPTVLGVSAGKAALAEAGLRPDQIQHVIIGNVIQSASDSIYTPRHIGLKLGIPISVPALGINRLCGSGFQVIVDAYHHLLAGDVEFALVGGVENMSMTPYVLRGARWGYRLGNGTAEDMMTTALTDSYTGDPMAITAENLGAKYNVTRQDADDFSLRSQELTKQAIADGGFKDEIAPFEMQDRKGEMFRLERDEHPRPETTKESLGKLKSIFKKDGLVTAGSASGIVDGAACLVVGSAKAAEKLKLRPLARMVSYGVSGCDPALMGIGPAPSTRQALERAGMTLDKMDLIEVNEAFAAQAIAVERELKIPREKLNLEGGAIAIGHPLAASGSRIIAHLIHQLRKKKKRYGLGTACIGGGQGIAVIIENLEKT